MEMCRADALIDRNPLQCVILIGGLGTRLGAMTRDIPKPLLEVGGIPFLEYLIAEAARFGFEQIVLLAGRLADKVDNYLRQADPAKRYGVEIRLVIEPAPLGTGGALVNAKESLAKEFLLINGDTFFSFNWLDLVARTRANGRKAGMALRRIPIANRYETILLEGELVKGFRPREETTLEALINGGAYFLSRDVVDRLTMPSSLEQDLFPTLVAEGEITGIAYDGFFIDIGVPETFAQAQSSVPASRRRAAVFLDRDGVLNFDHGYVHKAEDFEWVPGAKSAIKLLNDLGFYVFIVTNQAGIARGYYTESDLRALATWMQRELREVGAHIDDWRFCPFHPEAVLPEFRGDHPWRKPHGGMIADLVKHWPVDIASSLLIGDQPTDIAAAHENNVPGYLFTGGDLEIFVRRILSGSVKA